MEVESEKDFKEKVIAAVHYATSKLSDESVKYSVGTRSTGAGLEIIVITRPEIQQKERQRRKELGRRLY